MDDQKAYEEAKKKINAALKSGTSILDLSDNQLTALPCSITQLTQLEELHLSGNELTTLPDSIGQLAKLDYIDLSNNQLTTLPDSIGQLTQLEELHLSGNELTILPDSIGQLSKLKGLDLSDNQLTILPDSIVQLHQLDGLDLSGNKLTTLPDSIAQLTQLETLFLSSNHLATLRDSIALLTQLKRLSLSNIQLTILPDSIGQLTQLEELDLYGNKLTTLPDSIGQLTQLEELDLSGNKLTTLPDSIGQLSQLDVLDLSGNKLTTLPDSIGQLSQLDVLDLSGNKLTTLPDSIGQLTQLTRLAVTENRMITLPDSIGQLTQLAGLHLSANQLTTLPCSIGQLAQLEELEVAANKLTTLPDSIGQLTQMDYIHLSGNQLTMLPDSFSQLTKLYELNLAGNQLATLPDSIGQLSQLNILRLASNQLTTLPDWIAQLTQLEILSLESNHLTTLPNVIYAKRLYLQSNPGLHLPKRLEMHEAKAAIKYVNEYNLPGKWLNTAGLENYFLNKYSRTALTETLIATSAALFLLSFIDNPLLWFTWASLGWLLLLRTEVSSKNARTLLGQHIERNKIKSGYRTRSPEIFTHSLRLLYVGLLSIPIKVCTTLKGVFLNTVSTIKCIPDNFVTQTLKMDYSSPPELIPGSEIHFYDNPDHIISTVDLKYDISVSAPTVRDHRVFAANPFIKTIQLALFATAWLYRWSLKSTALIYFPLYLIHNIKTQKSLKKSATLYSKEPLHRAFVVFFFVTAVSIISWDCIGHDVMQKYIHDNHPVALSVLKVLQDNTLAGYETRLSSGLFVIVFTLLSANLLATLFTSKRLDALSYANDEKYEWMVLKGLLISQFTLSIIVMAYFYEWAATHMIAGWWKFLVG